MAADGFKEIAIVFGHSRSMSCRYAMGVARKNRLFPDHALGLRCVGAAAAQVNSAGRCRKSRQEWGFSCGLRGLGRKSQPDWRVVVHVELREIAVGVRPFMVRDARFGGLLTMRV